MEINTNFEMGSRGITVDMDRPRELVFTLGAFRAMGDAAHGWVKKADISTRDIVGPAMLQRLARDENGKPLFDKDGKPVFEQIPNPAMITATTVMRNLGDDNFLSIALWGALRKEQPRLRLEEVDAIYEAFLEKGGDRDDLIAVLVEAFARARNPHRLQQARELEKIQVEAAKKAAESPGPSEEPTAKEESSSDTPTTN